MSSLARHGRNSLVHIYSLTDSETHQFYVGSSYRPSKRYGQLLTWPPNVKMAKWIALLKVKGQRPVLTILDTCYEFEAPQSEEDALAMLLAVRGEEACMNRHRFIERIHSHKVRT